MPRPKESFTLSESIHSLRKLIAIGMVCKQFNVCIGEITANDIVCVDGAFHRVQRKNIFVKMRHKYAFLRHLRLGHDVGCREYGVPISVIRGLVVHWSGGEAATFVATTYALVCNIAEVEAGTDEQRLACFENEFKSAEL